MDKCETNLKRLGFVLGSNNKSVNLSINALRRIDVDRLTVSPNIKKKTTSKNIDQENSLNPFDASDDAESDSALLAHLVKDISDVGLDDTDQDTRVCDLMVTG
jgi:hypothetical protein